MARLDFVLVAMILVLAFLLGSFAVRNSDFWMHLATGRAIASGQYTIGVDPFSYTTENITWVNQSWLYNLLIYAVYQTLGGTVLVVLKALVVVVIAVAMLQMRRPNQSLWIPAVCTGLALLTLSPRLQFQPVIVSLLFLALTMLILHKARNTRWLWLLVPLFILWVNMDAWFLLGPIAAGLFLLGETIANVLTPSPAPAKGQPKPAAPSIKRLLIVVAAATGACLINPYHVHAFTTLPVEVTFADYATLLRTDSASPVTWMFFSVWQPEYWSTRVALSVAGVVFVPLTIAGVFSFLVNYRNLNWSRLLLFVAFAAMGLWRSQCLGFFAILAGPISALNFQDFVARRSPQGSSVPQLDWVPFLKGFGITLVVLAVFAIVVKTSLISIVIDMLVKATMNVEGVARTLGLPDPSWPFLVFAVLTLGLFFVALGPVLRILADVLVSWPLGGRLLTVVVALVLLVMVWPGWLQVGGFANDPQVARRVAWTVDPDPSLMKVAETLKDWRDKGLLPADARGFHTLPQTANYFAWFSPTEKGFYDHRYALFGEVTEPFLEMRRLLTSDDLIALIGPVGEGLTGGSSTARLLDQQLARMEKLFRDHKVHYVVLTGLDTNSALIAVRNTLILEAKKPAWKMLYMDGKSVILSWHDPSTNTPDTLKPKYYDPDKEAFAPQNRVVGMPDHIPTAPPQAFDLSRYMNPPRPRLLETDEALMQLFYFQGADRVGFRQQQLQRAYVPGLGAGLFGVVSGATSNGAFGITGLGERLSAAWLVSFRASIADLFYRQPNNAQRPSVGPQVMAAAGMSGFITQNVYDEIPPGPAILGIRAARRSLANNPDDAVSYFRLAKLYQALATQTRERHWNMNGALASKQVMTDFGLRGATPIPGTVIPDLTKLRQVQYIAALHQAELLAPDEEDIQHALAQHFDQLDAIDQSVKHRKRAFELFRQSGPANAEEKEAFDLRVEEIERQLDGLQRRLELVENEFQKQALRLQRPLERAMMARQFGLLDKALEIVLPLGEGDVNPEVVQLQLELLLTTGRVDELTTRFCGVDRRFKEELELKKKLGVAFFAPAQGLPAEAWYGMLLAAALGDYARADEYLEEMAKGYQPEPVIVQAVSNILVERSQPGPIIELFRLMAHPETHTPQILQGAGAMIRYRLNLMTLRGLLALEAGDTIEARTQFEEALKLSMRPERFHPLFLLMGSGSQLEYLNGLAMTSWASMGPVHLFEGQAAAAYYLDLLQKAAP